MILVQATELAKNWAKGRGELSSPSWRRAFIFGLMFVSLAAKVESALGQASRQALGQASANEQATEVQATEVAPGASSKVDSQQLAEKNYSARQQATLEMWRRRDLSRDEVQMAARDNDPEVASRARWILRQWRRGALPDTPPDVSRLLGRTDDPSAIEELLGAGQFNAAVVAVEESAGTADRDIVRMRAVVSLQLRFPIYAIQALQSRTIPDLLKLVDLVADSKEMAVTRIELMQKLGLEFDDDSLLPEAAEQWTEIERAEARVMIYSVLGRFDKAIEAAQRGAPELLRVVRMLDGRWAELARESSEQASTQPAGSIEALRLWGDVLAGADRAGLEDLRQQAVAALSSPDAAKSEAAIELRWRNLASHGEIDAALEILRQDQVGEAALVAIVASRADQAFEWFEEHDGEIEMNLTKRIDDALAAQSTSVSKSLVPELADLLALMRCLLSVGRNDLAWHIAEKLNRSSVEMDNYSVRELTLRSLAVTRRDDWVLKLAVSPSDESISPGILFTTANVLVDADQGTLKTLLEAFGQIYPELPLSQRFQSVCALVNGDIPPAWNRETDFQRLYDELSTGKRHSQRVGGQARIAVTPQLNLNIVELFGRHGEVELANKALQRMVGLGDVAAAFQLAENQLAAGRGHSAESLYNSIIKTIASERSYRQSSIVVTGTDIAAKSIAAKWILAKRSTDPDAVEKLNDELRIALCSPSTELRLEVAKYLSEHGEVELATEIYQRLLPMSVYETREGTSFYDVSNNFVSLTKDNDIGLASNWFDIAVRGTMESRFLASASVTLPLFVSRWKLEAAIQGNDREGVERHLSRILQLNPMDIDTAETVFPKMSKAAMQERVDTAMATILERGTAYLEQFSLDATTLNNLAWITAINDTELDKAVQWSTQAVYLEPDSAIYRDTLAEALFRFGEVDQAIQIERACLIDEPAQWHLHEQIDRFEKALGNNSD